MYPTQNSKLRTENWFDYIQSLDHVDTPQHSRGYHFNNGIARARRLLERLGGAPKATTACVLVAGSKGKGSTAAMLSSILAAAGYRVGAFTGPHLHTPLERFAILAPADPASAAATRPIDQRWMSARIFDALAGRVREIVETWDRPDLGTPTRFEAFTAMAYRWFEEQGADLTVMEIGIGGRLDAVNLANPMLSVITNISLEHTEILGSTLPQIAREKAGIMRAGRPAVSSEQTPEVRRTLCEEAERTGARLSFADDACWVEQVGIQFARAGEPGGQWIRFHGERSGAGSCDESPAILLALHGAYQLQNVATARAAVGELCGLGYGIHAGATRAGLRQVRWPGRFEVLGWDPVVIADGAHTPHSMRQLCESLRQYFHDRRLHFIVGILRDKDARSMLEAIAAEAASVTVCEMPVRRAIPAEHLRALWNELPSPRVTPVRAPNLAEALVHARAGARTDDVICVTGSLHLVAEAEELLKR